VRLSIDVARTEPHNVAFSGVGFSGVAFSGVAFSGVASAAECSDAVEESLLRHRVRCPEVLRPQAHTQLGQIIADGATLA
jgi:hypothetical protein